MKIKVIKSCWTPKPQKKWSAGETYEVSEEVGKKLLTNNNFVLATTKEEVKDEMEKDDSDNRKKRSIRSGN